MQKADDSLFKFHSWHCILLMLIHVGELVTTESTQHMIFHLIKSLILCFPTKPWSAALFLRIEITRTYRSPFLACSLST